MRKKELGTKGIVINLSEMVPANESPAPYTEMLLSDNKDLVKPLIKYGVNPANGIPLSDEFMSSIIEAAGSLGNQSPIKAALDCYQPVVIGERRKVLIDVFYMRADLLFKNMIQALNVQMDKEMRYRFRDIYDRLSERNFDPWGYGREDNDIRILNMFSPSLFSRDNYVLNYNDDPFIGSKSIGRRRDRMSKLVDLEYYMKMPLGTVLEGILSHVSADYSETVSRATECLLTSKGIGTMAIYYDDFMQFIGTCYANLIACAEAIVNQLYDEAASIASAGFPSQYGVEYDDFFNSHDAACREAEQALITAAAVDVLKDDPNFK